MKLVYLNARSLAGDSKRRCFEFEIIRQFDYPDIVVVTETWLNDKIPTSLFDCAKHYNVYRLDRQGRPGGGVAIFVKRNIRSHDVFVPNVDGLEALAVAVVLKKSKLFISSIYKPSVSDVHLLAPLKRFVEHIISKRGRHVFVGDFNLPDVDWINLTAPGNGKQDKFLNIFTKRGLSQLVRTPTRGNNILDLIFVDDVNVVNQVKVLETFASSDHSVVMVDLSLYLSLLETGN